MTTDLLITIGVFSAGGIMLFMTVWYQYRFVFQDGWVRIVIIGNSETRLMKRLRMDRDFDAKNSDGEMMKYEIDERHQIRGKWNVPTQFYWLDHSEPIQIKNVNRQSTPKPKLDSNGEQIVIDGEPQFEPLKRIDLDDGDVLAWDGPRAVDLYERTESHVASDAINSFRNSGMSASQGIMIVLVVLMGVGGMLWYTNDQAFTEIKFRLDSENNAAQVVSPTPVGGINPNGPGVFD